MMKPNKAKDVWIQVLLIVGWIFPSILPPYGVALASTGLQNPYNFWNYVCVGNIGFFSDSVLVEHTLEQASHGHSFAVGPCIPANLLGILLPVSGVLIINFLAIRRLIFNLWVFIVIILTLSGTHLSFTSWRFPWESLLLLFVFTVFLIYMVFQKIRAKRQGRNEIYSLASNILLFYPIWILALSLTQRVYPFVGLVSIAIGCFLLARKEEHVLVKADQVVKASL